MKCLVVITGICVLIISCNRNEFDGSHCSLKATVIQTSNIDCNRPLLVFEDTVALRQLTGFTGSVFIASALPPELNILNKHLWVCAGKLTGQEDFACTLMGQSYPHVKIVYARERN
jgi:hypothetical protein